MIKHPIGHAPGDIREAFLDAIEGSLSEVELRDEMVSLHDLCGHLWHCSDILPGWVYGELGMSGQMNTYAAAARHIRANASA